MCMPNAVNVIQYQRTLCIFGYISKYIQLLHLISLTFDPSSGTKLYPTVKKYQYVYVARSFTRFLKISHSFSSIRFFKQLYRTLVKTPVPNPKASTSIHNSTPSALEINRASPTKKKNGSPHVRACFRGVFCGDW